MQYTSVDTTYNHRASKSTCRQSRFLICVRSACISVTRNGLLFMMMLYSNETLYIAFVYDILATFVVFILSFLTNNSTWYDPYWSVSPIVLSAYFHWRTSEGYVPRHILLMFLVMIWGIRLTYNWVIGFLHGLGATSEQHEDWRYVYISTLLCIFHPLNRNSTFSNIYKSLFFCIPLVFQIDTCR